MIGTVLSNRYRLNAKLGSGGMSTVYLAHDRTLDREVAIKVLNHELSEQPGHEERFKREARDMAKLSHANVVSVIDAGEDDGRRYIVFECIDGETLKRRINRLGQLPADEAAAYAIEIGRALQAAHERKIVHRDVKPQNVLIDRDGRAKLTDFGIARTLGRAGLTVTGRILGTTDYVSPEQAMGEDVDERSDIYSLGVVLYEMLIGDVPFQADSMVAVAMKHIHEPLPNVQLQRSEVSSALAAVIERATEKDPRRRYRNMAEMLAALETALEVEVSRGGGVPHGEATAVLESVPEAQRIIKPQRSSRAGLVMAAIGIGLIVGILLVTNGGPSNPRDSGLLRAVAAHDFDPYATDGNPVEHPEETGLAIDGNPTNTGWETETYRGGNLGKLGVGLYIDAGHPVTARAVALRTSAPGWSAELRAADAVPDSIEGWGTPIGSAPSVRPEQRIDVASPAPHRYYLIWITQLPASGQATIEDVRLVR
ncbi:MAG: eukaryotic-like serine/threonine-protein kinase [Solirubrobacterales bacterium]|nr:eukaryotic-like serine/threonine-protein kinase [Solirubrobacterales bacterium]